MKSLFNRSFTSATQAHLMRIVSIACVVFVIFLSSCSTSSLTQRGIPLGEESSPPPHYSMVFVIHGDGDYGFHDPLGNVHRADEEALMRAKRVAMQNPQAEVFIFHEKPRKHTLLFFPRRDGKFYYYRQGRMMVTESYWRDQGPSRFDTEVKLYNQFHAAEQPQPVRVFLYFGHEIPEYDGAGYDASYSHRTFTVRDLAEELKRITPDSTKFDLIVLSTCFNGTPHTIAALAPYARTIVASPDNLHLSYFDLQPFEQLDARLHDGDIAGFAKNFALQSFDRLTEDIQTAVTVAVYDVDRVQGFLHAVDSTYNHTLTALKGQKPGSVGHCDCAEDSAYALPGISEGVDVFYRPPRFGRSKHKLNHSGWECRRLSK